MVAIAKFYPYNNNIIIIIIIQGLECLERKLFLLVFILQFLSLGELLLELQSLSTPS